MSPYGGETSCGVLEGAVNGVRREHVLDRHNRRSDHSGPVAEPARDDSEVARCEWEGAADDSLARAGQELRVCFGDVSADDDYGGVEEVDGPREDLPERAPGVPHHPDRASVTAADETDYVAAT